MANRPIIEITRDRIATKFRELSDRSHAQSNQAFRILRALLNFARAAYRPDNKPMLIENPVDILSQTKVWNRSAKIGAHTNRQNRGGVEFLTDIAGR